MMFQEKLDQRIKQQEEELQQLSEIYHEKQQKIMIYSSANALKVSRETAYQIFKRQEKSLNQMRDELDGKSKMLSSEHFKSKFKRNISPYDFFLKNRKNN